jgi:diaminopimelate decarboxylase
MTNFKKLFPYGISQGVGRSLKIAGHDIDDLAKQWGTPLYIYDAETIFGRYREIEDILTKNYRGDFDISYASKAYFSLGFARKISKLDMNLDTVSYGELAIAKKAGFQPYRIHLHGNNKSATELKFALDWGIDNIVVDSLEELCFLETLARDSGKITRIWLRIMPGIEVDTHQHLQTGHIASKFGLPIEDGQAGKAIQIAQKSDWLRLTGLHTHIGSQIFTPGVYKRAMQMLIGLAESENYIPQEISPGGGWGVPYVEGDSSLDIDEVFQEISETLHAACDRMNWPLPKLVIEPGRWLVARAGVAVYSVGTTKFTSEGTYIVSVDGGMADNPRQAMYNAEYSAFLVDDADAKTEYHSALVGKYCESGDQLIPALKMPRVRRGDLIAIPMSGAYHLSLSSNYNLAPRPAVLWLERGKVDVLQQRERLEQTGWWVSGIDAEN